MTQVEVIVPHRSRWDLLARLLESLRAQTVRPAICVVDNASEDETLAALDRVADVRCVRLPTNVGFGRAVNAGVRSSQAEYVVLVNNDMEAEPRFVEAMLAALRAEPPSAVAAMQLRSDGKVDTIGVAVDQSLCAYDVAHGTDADGSWRHDALEPIGPSGGAAGYRRDTYLEVGGYDENIFAYLEDVDLALRMNAAGVRYRLAADARIWHRHSATLGAGSRSKNQLMGWSRGYLLRKYRQDLGVGARVRGVLVDCLVYGGQAVIDRNCGSLQGRIAFLRWGSATGSSVRGIQTAELGLRTAIARKLSRRTAPLITRATPTSSLGSPRSGTGSSRFQRLRR